MEEGLFRSELEAVLERYGYLLWRRCKSVTSGRQSAEAHFRAALSRVASTGAALRGREDKLGWLYETVDGGAGRPPPAETLDLEAWHAGDPSPTARRRAEHDVEAKPLVAELDLAKERFGSELDLRALVDELFRDEPLPILRPNYEIGAAALLLIVGAVSALLFWPRADAPAFIPDALGLSLLIEREGKELRSSEARAVLLGGDRVRVEVSIPKQQTMSVLLLERDGSLTPLAIGRLFRPGVHVLPQLLHIDEKTPLVARIFAGPPGLVRTATSTGRMDGVLTISLEPKVAKQGP